ncbi:MAG: tyramine oxidase [Chloroflexi bacterium]|nr:tyramine oxidase [Chloroflexota bacterium]|tara:strand:- start:4345 stop:6312 length:1968 start_codon:yes stop_codon:yes gene_type:complete
MVVGDKLEQANTQADVANHPLDPLSAEEIDRAVAIVKASAGLTDNLLFETIVLREPSKNDVLNFHPGAYVPREAFLVALDSEKQEVHELIVSLDTNELLQSEHIEGVQPAFIFGDHQTNFLQFESKIKHDPRYVEALSKRGITNPDLVMIDPWPISNFGDEKEKGKRLAIGRAWLRREATDNGYARPIEGLSVIIDLDKSEIFEIQDFGVVPIPPEDGNYATRYQESFREDLKPIEITQPEGASFTVTGKHVDWQKWQFRVGYTPREGLVIHNVTYQDQGKNRSVLYRGALSEMVVPYGDPTNDHYKKQVFDSGEVGIGKCANSLELGCDCLGEIYYFDVSLYDITGRANTQKNVICMHEEDFGVLWKHTDNRIGETEVRRSRRLVVSFFTTVGNYEYGFFWYFYQDGSIDYQVKLTGVVNSSAMLPGAKPKHGTLVAPQVVAHNHQHYFNVRLDMMVDGQENSVYEVDTVRDPISEENKHGNAFSVKKTLLTEEADFPRKIDPYAARYWTVANHSRHNYMGEPVSYKIAPGENVLPFHHDDAVIMKRAAFMTGHMWATEYDRDEMFAAGNYPNQHSGGDGLPKWMSGNRSLENKDVVIWYTFGHNHIPRLEDWPVMPVAYTGFSIRPSGFFDRNPALDVPPSDPHCKCDGDCAC